MICKAECHLADDFGDNHATMHCQLDEGHPPPHREEFRDGTCVLTWERDERRVPCSACGGEGEIRKVAGPFLVDGCEEETEVMYRRCAPCKGRGDVEPGK